MGVDLTAQFVRDFERLEAALAQFVRDFERLEAALVLVFVLRDCENPDRDPILAALRKELAEAQSHQTVLQNQLNQAQSHQADLQNQLNEAQSQFNSLKTQFDETIQELANERKQVKDLESKLEPINNPTPEPPTPTPEPPAPPEPPTGTDGQLAIALYELMIERENIRKLERDNDDLRDQLHRYENPDA